MKITISKCLMSTLGLILIVSLLTNCKTKQAQTAGVHYRSTQNKTVTVTSTGFGKSKKDAVFNAEKNAFEVLLFQGIPGSPYEKPLIPNADQSVKSSHSNYFESFYEQRAYRSFVTTSSIISPGSKDKLTNKIVAGVELTINVPTLRRDLEQNGITKKFGL